MRTHLLSSVTVSLLTVQLVSARWAGNLNYRSPSENHPSLGISIHKVVKRNSPEHCWKPDQLSFTHGIASGDPYPHSVILWTRIAPYKDNHDSNVTVSGYVPAYSHETAQYVQASKCPICVEYTVAKDEQLKDVVNCGKAYTTSDIDYTVKVGSRLHPLDCGTIHAFFFRCSRIDLAPRLRRETWIHSLNITIASMCVAVT